jgi:hypothetical protein
MRRLAGDSGGGLWRRRRADDGAWVGEMRMGGREWQMWVWSGARVYNIHLTYDSLMWAIIDYS